jgi:Cysteine-rich secretory protein family
LKGTSTSRVYGKVLAFDTATLSRGLVNYSFSGYSLSTPSSLDRSPGLRYVSRGTALLDRTHETIGVDRVRLTPQSRKTLFRFQVPIGKRVQSEYYVTLPNGDVRISTFPSQYIDPSGYLRTGVPIQAEFPMETDGTYMLETLEHDGFAYFNLPATRGNVWNIVTPVADADIRNIRKSETTVRSDTYKAINTLRISLGRSLIERDPILDTVAQKKADNMATNTYVGHTTPDGKNIREFALSQGIRLSGSIGENVA